MYDMEMPLAKYRGLVPVRTWRHGLHRAAGLESARRAVLHIKGALKL